MFQLCQSQVETVLARPRFGTARAGTVALHPARWTPPRSGAAAARTAAAAADDGDDFGGDGALPSIVGAAAAPEPEPFPGGLEAADLGW